MEKNQKEYTKLLLFRKQFVKLENTMPKCIPSNSKFRQIQNMIESIKSHMKVENSSYIRTCYEINNMR